MSEPMSEERLQALRGIALQWGADLLEILDEISRLRAANGELTSRLEKANSLLHRCYDSGHRKGWEEGETTNEVMEAVMHYFRNYEEQP